MTAKSHNPFLAAVVASELIHIFCCGIPVLFSLVSLLSGLGVMVMPHFFVELHDVLHDWEVPMIVLSGFILALGWGFHHLSEKMDCRVQAGCHHEPCGPKKSRSHRILVIASILFVANVSIYVVFHRGLNLSPSAASGYDHRTHDHQHDHDHDHSHGQGHDH